MRIQKREKDTVGVSQQINERSEKMDKKNAIWGCEWKRK